MMTKHPICHTRITLDPLPGEDVKDACTLALWIAKLSSQDVTVHCNGETLIVSPSDESAQKAVDYYHHRLKVGP